MQGEICYLLNGCLIHLVKLLQCLQSGIIQEQGFLGAHAIGNVVKVGQEIDGLSRIIFDQCADHLCHVGLAVNHSYGDLTAPLSTRTDCRNDLFLHLAPALHACEIEYSPPLHLGRIRKSTLLQEAGVDVLDIAFQVGEHDGSGRRLHDSCHLPYLYLCGLLIGQISHVSCQAQCHSKLALPGVIDGIEVAFLSLDREMHFGSRSISC